MAQKIDSKGKENRAVGPTAVLPANQERLTIPLTKDNKIHWDGIRPARRDALRKLLADSGVKAVEITPALPMDPVVNAALCNTLYDLLAQLEALAATRVLGCTVDQAFAALRFTAEEKSALAAPTVKVINKYLPASLIDRYADECMLLLLLVTMTRAKVTHLQESMRRHSALHEVNRESHKKESENKEIP